MSSASAISASIRSHRRQLIGIRASGRPLTPATPCIRRRERVAGCCRLILGRANSCDLRSDQGCTPLPARYPVQPHGAPHRPTPLSTLKSAEHAPTMHRNSSRNLERFAKMENKLPEDIKAILDEGRGLMTEAIEFLQAWLRAESPNLPDVEFSQLPSDHRRKNP